ncbi:MAG TPA: NAD(P)/FAD-dependent oxidoreductase [Stellaceae bacterium]|jgi:flavin-dependent dehydrogenase|nr:NAD(P)/FAD-dependent oxidoreductase [Stellaceae bacterium]
MTKAEQESCDVLVVGAGPGGSTIAALLAERGRNVVLLEKDHHPRFHIGESLLPMNLMLFEKLGIRDQVDRIGMIKHGVEFISPSHNRVALYDFSNAIDKRYPFAYQVRRSVLDEILFNNARAKGATAIEGCRVADVSFEGAQGAVVRATGEDGAERSWRARFVVDATGRDTLLASKFGLKQRNRRHNSAAMFGHFSGARRLPGKLEGNISIFWFDKGWFWFIPLLDGTTSVGAVCQPGYFKSRKSDFDAFFKDTIAMCPAIAERLSEATLLAPVTGTGNYSYRADRTGGEGYILLGDAYAFIDPIFSAGVYFAMNSAFAGADAVETCLDRPRLAKQALRQFDAMTRRGLDSFSWYIYRATRPALRNMFMSPRNILGIESAMLSLLAGDVFRRSSVKTRLIVFKTIYYVSSVLTPRRTFEAWLRQWRNLQVE